MKICFIWAEFEGFEPRFLATATTGACQVTNQSAVDALNKKE
jgi:hypothetical protein